MRWASTLAVLFIVLLLPAGAAATPTWLGPVTLSPAGEENLSGDIALGPDGTAIAVWRRATCSGSSEKHKCENGRIQYAVRPPGGSFSAAVEMPADPGEPGADTPRVAFDGAGSAIAVWASSAGPVKRIRYSFRPPGGAFGATETIAEPLEGFPGFPQLAITPGGRAVVAFERYVEGKPVPSYAVRPAGGDFGPTETIAGDTGGLNGSPIVRLDDAGNGIAAWMSNEPEVGLTVRYAQLAAGSSQFAPTQTIELGALPDLAMSPSGAAVIVWTASEGADEVRYAFRPPGGNFGPSLSIPEPEGPLAPSVAMDPEGRAVVIWSYLNNPVYVTRWAAAPAGGPFGPPFTVAPGRDASPTDLAISRQGTALVLLADRSGQLLQTAASLRPPGGAFGEPVLLPGPPQGISFGGVAAAFDPDGNAAALWSGREPSTDTPHDVPVLAAGLDGAGPRIDSLRVPARAGERKRVTMTMTATDVWSSVASTGFEFGDRDKAAGPSVRHRYRRAGKYTVTASATDAFGNTTSVTRVLRVLNLKPSIGKLRLVPRAFPVAAAGSSRASRRTGTSIRFRLSERATVRLTVLRRRRGARASAKRGGFKRVGRIVRRNRRAGANRIRFSGHIGEKTLVPGSYRFVAVATDRNNKRSKPRKAGFRVLGAGR